MQVTVTFVPARQFLIRESKPDDTFMHYLTTIMQHHLSLQLSRTVP